MERHGELLSLNDSEKTLRSSEGFILAAAIRNGGNRAGSVEAIRLQDLDHKCVQQGYLTAASIAEDGCITFGDMDHSSKSTYPTTQALASRRNIDLSGYMNHYNHQVIAGNG